MDSLKQTQQKLDGAILRGDLHGQVSTWGDPIQNRVYVDLLPDATVTADEIRGNFGSEVRVGTSEAANSVACGDWNNCAVDRWRGGLPHQHLVDGGLLESVRKSPERPEGLLADRRRGVATTLRTSE
jgi:hypothetical protein